MDSNTNKSKETYDEGNIVILNEDKVSKPVPSNSTSGASNNEHLSKSEFEQPAKKIELEDQSEKTRKLNETINKLEKDIQKRTQQLNQITNDEDEDSQKQAKIQKLNQIIKNLKKDNLKLSKRNEEMQTQNETMIKNLKEDCLKLARENVELKYGNGSNVQQGHQVPQMPQGPPQGVQTSYRMQHQRPVMMQQVQIVRSANGQPLRNLRPGQQIRFATQDHPGPWGPYGRGPTF